MDLQKYDRRHKGRKTNEEIKSVSKFSWMEEADKKKKGKEEIKSVGESEMAKLVFIYIYHNNKKKSFPLKKFVGRK